MIYVFPIWLFIIVLAVGSFLNVCIFRLPRKKSILFPPSSCTFCGNHIRYRDNIPVVSYILLKGKCRDCGDSISIRYPLVELLCGILTLAAWLWFGYSYQTIGVIVLTYILIPVVLIDLEFHIIPNSIIATGLLAGLLIQAFSVFSEDYLSWLSFLFGGIIGAGLLLFASIIGKVLFKKESMGMGDIKLALVLGWFLGVQNILVGMFLSFIFAAIIGGGLLLIKGNKPVGVIPFAPYLGLGALTGMYFGDFLSNAYLEWIGII